MPLYAICPEDMAAWFGAASRDKPGAANRALEILRVMMNRAEEWGLRERDINPCLGIARNPGKQVACLLDEDGTGPPRACARRPRSPLARGRRRDPAAAAVKF